MVLSARWPSWGAKEHKTHKAAARVIHSTDGKTLQGFVNERAADGVEIFPDDAAAYSGLSNHDTV